MQLILRRANASCRGGTWSEYDFDVFDGDREVGRIYLVQMMPEPIWFWGVSFMLTGKKSYGRAPTLKEAMAKFKAAYLEWRTRSV